VGSEKRGMFRPRECSRQVRGTDACMGTAGLIHIIFLAFLRVLRVFVVNLLILDLLIFPI
jgi:hypothetical protein